LLQKVLNRLDVTDKANLAVLQVVARNDHALLNMAVVFTTAKAMTHLYKATDNDWPYGLAVNVVGSLSRNIVPKTLSQELNMNRI
jgi:hypothetical protein